jgi:hypothetical protein
VQPIASDTTALAVGVFESLLEFVKASDILPVLISYSFLENHAKHKRLISD